MEKIQPHILFNAISYLNKKYFRQKIAQEHFSKKSTEPVETNKVKMSQCHRLAAVENNISGAPMEEHSMLFHENSMNEK